MNNFVKILSCGLLVQSATSFSCMAAEYAEPKISSIMFHVDKLPLDHDRIKSISRDLTILASKNPNGNPIILRTNGRLLAIALRLDSKNEEAKKLNQKLKNKAFIVEPRGDVYLKTRNRVLGLIKGLSRVEQYNEAHRLLSYMKDAVKDLAPNDPVLQKHQVMPQRWENVIPSLTDKPPVRQTERKDTVVDKHSHENKMPDKHENKPPVDKTDTADNSPPEVDKQPSSTEAKWHHLSSELSSPVYIYEKIGEKATHTLEHCKFKVSIKPRSGGERIKLYVSPKPEGDGDHKLRERVKKYLENRWKEHPAVEIKISTSGVCSKRYGEKNLLPVFMQLHASLSDNKLKPDVIVLGDLRGGDIKRDSLFWRQLKVIRQRDKLKQTLICPVSAERDLFQLVALEEADFFVRNEVVLVNDIDEAVKFSSELKDVDLKLAHEEFVKVRDLIGSRSVGSYSVNKKVREKLENILKLNPNHMSAKMILMRGDTKRSSKIEPFYVAEEFKPLVQHQAYIADKDDPQHLNKDDLKRRAKQLDDALEPMLRYIDSEDREMRDALKEMIDELKNMSRALEKKDSDYHKRSLRVAHERFQKHYKTALEYIKNAQNPDQ